MFTKILNKKSVFVGTTILAFTFVIVVALWSIKYSDEVNAFQHNASIFYQMQTQEDELPEGHSLESVDPTTTRLIVERPGESYWVASNELDQICVIAMLGGETDDWVIGLSCDSEARFIRHGVGVTVKSVVDNETILFASAVFIPDGYNHSVVEILPEAYIANNLIVFDSMDSLENTTNTRRSVIIPPDSKIEGLEELELIFP